MNRLPLKVLSRAARLLAYELRPAKPLDFRGKVSHPLDALYLVGDLSCLIDIELQHCRSALGFPYGRDLHPFSNTIRGILEGKVTSYEGSPLQRQHLDFQPRTAAESLGLSPEGEGEWRRLPPHARVLPWETTAPAKKQAALAATTEKDNRQRGERLGIEAGLGLAGPVDPRKGELEFNALKAVAESIKLRGYQRHDGQDGDITGTALISDGEVRILVRSGKHRIAALDALGYKLVPIRIKFKRPARPEEVQHWPHVRDGMFKVDEALDIFRHVFDGIPFSKRAEP